MAFEAAIILLRGTPGEEIGVERGSSAGDVEAPASAEFSEVEAEKGRTKVGLEMEGRERKVRPLRRQRRQIMAIDTMMHWDGRVGWLVVERFREVVRWRERPYAQYSPSFRHG